MITDCTHYENGRQVPCPAQCPAQCWPWEDFHEDDEPPGKIQAVFDAGIKGVTRRPLEEIMTNLKRYRVPMYVEAECLGVDEMDAANRIAAALSRVNMPGQSLYAELRPGQPLKAEDGDSRIFIHEAEHVGTAVLLGLIRLRKGERR